MNKEQWVRAKDILLAGAAAIGSVAVNALGGWDTALQTLLLGMTLDYMTGLLVAGVFQRSDKSGDGALDSRAGFRGLCKKGAELVLVLVAVRLDLLVEGAYARTAVLLFLIGNEGLSVLENLGLMGAPYPAFLKHALSVLREQGDQGKESS